MSIDPLRAKDEPWDDQNPVSLASYGRLPQGEDGSEPSLPLLATPITEPIAVSLDLIAKYGALIAAAVAGVAYVWTRRRKEQNSTALAIVSAPLATAPAGTDGDHRQERSLALDAISEAVLIVREDGRVRDSNSAALTLFNRHRTSMEEVYVSALRTLDDESRNAYQLARERGVWAGESWARIPDGSVTLCLTRIVPLQDAQGRTSLFAESYRDVVSEQLASRDLRDRLFGARHDLAAAPEGSSATLSLARLGAAFRDLEVAVQRYERVLNALSMQDPLTEPLAGLVHEVREASSSDTTQALLRDIPGVLAALRTQLTRLNGSRAAN